MIDSRNVSDSGYYDTQIDDKGRVLRQSELIAHDLKPIILAAYDIEDWDDPFQYDARVKLLKVLTAYVLQRVDDDHWPTLKQGRAIGHKEIVAIMETVIGEDVAPNMSNPDLHKIQSGQNRLRAEQRRRFTQAVAAITKATEVPDEQ